LTTKSGNHLSSPQKGKQPDYQTKSKNKKKNKKKKKKTCVWVGKMF